jgi:hypothetical protein
MMPKNFFIREKLTKEPMAARWPDLDVFPASHIWAG